MKNFKLIVISLVALLPLFSSCSTYNDMVSKQEGVESQWAQVENVYQRRADLIPNLVNTVKGYAKHEQETITAVIEARAKATSTTIDASSITAENIEAFQKAQGALTQALSRLLMVQEKYPELKADKMFQDLAVALEGTENRITVERQKFNDTAKDYNTTIRQFPGNIVAMIFSFEAKPYFKADAGAEKAPQVNF